VLSAANKCAPRFIANRFLRKRNLPHHQVEQHVEWCVCLWMTASTHPLISLGGGWDGGGAVLLLIGGQRIPHNS